MKAVKLLKLFREMLKVVSDYDLKADDYKYISLYEDYSDMVSGKYKKDAIYAILADRFSISESTVKRLIRRLGKEVIL